MEGLNVAEADLVVYAGPSKSNQVRRAVLHQLSSLLFTGKVVKLGKESIHIVVLGFSSAAVMLEDICEEFKYKIKHGEGVFATSSHKRHVIKAGNMRRFQVKSFDEEILHISGSLLASNTRCIQWLSKHGTEDGSYTDRSLKTSNIQREMQEEDTMNTTTGDKPLNATHKHKSKKRTRGDR